MSVGMSEISTILVPKGPHMADQKTKATTVSVDQYLETLSDEKVRADCFALTKIMQKVTGLKPLMWGPSIVGFGQYHFKYDSGREGDICLVGFSPRKANITLYVLAGFPGQEDLLKTLGKHKVGKGCLWVKKLDDIRVPVLESLIRQSADFLRKKYPA